MRRPSIRWWFDTAGAEPSGNLDSYPQPNICYSAEGVVLIAGNQTLSAIDFETGEVNWQVTWDEGMYLEGSVDSIVILSNDMYRSEMIAAYDLDSGDRVWERQIEFTETVLGESHVYLLSDDEVIALDVASGRQSWCYQTNHQSTIANLSYSSDMGVLIILTYDRIQLLDIHTGEVSWQLSPLFRGKATMINNGSIITLDDDYTVISIDRVTDEFDWKYNLPKYRPNVEPLSAKDQWILIKTNDITIIAGEDDPDFHDSDVAYLLSTSSGESQWLKEFSNSFRPLEGADGLLTDSVAILYNIEGDYSPIHCYDLHSGKLLWEIDLSPSEVHDLGGGNVGICSSGTFYVISAKTGDTKWTFTASDNQCGLTVTSDLFLLTDDRGEEGAIYALENELKQRTENNTKVYNSGAVENYCAECGTNLTEYSEVNFCPTCGQKT